MSQFDRSIHGSEVLRRRRCIRVASLSIVSVVLLLDFRNVVGAGHGRWQGLVRVCMAVGGVTRELSITRFAAVASVAIIGFVAVEEEAEDGREQEENSVLMHQLFKVLPLHAS